MSEATLAEASAAMKVAYPAIIVAWKSVGSRLRGLSEEDRKLAEDWQSVGDFLVWMDNHGDHGGWKFDKGTQAMTCECGELLYEVGDPLPAGGGTGG